MSLLFIYCFYLFERESFSFGPKMSQQAGLDQAKKTLEFNVGLPLLSHHLLLPWGCISGKMKLRMEPEHEPRYFNTGCRHPKWYHNCYTKWLLLSPKHSWPFSFWVLQFKSSRGHILRYVYEVLLIAKVFYFSFFCIIPSTHMHIHTQKLTLFRLTCA